MVWQPQTFQPAAPDPNAGTQNQAASTWQPKTFQTSNSNDQDTGQLADIGKSLVGNVAPNAAANYAANMISPLYTAGSYAAQLGMKGGQYLGEGADSLYRLASGQPQQSQSQYDSQSLDLMNAMRAKIGMQPTTNGDPSSLIPSPSNLVNGAADLIGHPLYQPQTDAGQLATTFGNLATGGLGSGIKAGPALMGALGGTALPYGIKQAGGTQAEQFLGGLAGGIGGAKLGGISGSSAMSDTEQGALNDLASSPDKMAQITSPQLKEISGRVYQQADAEGGAIPPQDTNSFIDGISQASRQTTEGNLFRGGNDPIADLAQRLEPLRDKPISFQGADDIDKQLTDLIHGEVNTKGQMSSLGQQYLTIQDNLRDLMTPDEVTPENQGFQTRRTAQQIWAQSRSLGDVESIIQKAQMAENPSTAIKNGFKLLYNNNRRMMGYNDAERSAIKDAATRGLGGDFFNTFGSRLGPLIAGGVGSVGGPIGSAIGAAAGFGLSKASRNIADQMQLNRANKVTNLISNRNELPDLNITPQSSSLQLQALPRPSINVPPDGFNNDPQQPTPSQPDRIFNSSQRQIGSQFYAPDSRAITYQPRPDFIGTANGQIAQTPNIQANPYQFGEGQGMPFAPGEMKNVDIRSSNYQNMPISSQQGQTAFNNAMTLLNIMQRNRGQQ